GYGLTEIGGEDGRVQVSFPILRVGPATDVGLDTGSGPIDATQLYFRVPGKNTCLGDSGGPAFIARQGVERLAAVTSSGDAASKLGGVDARPALPAIVAFIQPAIDELEAGDPCRADGVCNEACDRGPALVDPDCAPRHCAADGICAVACVDPP